MQDKIGIIILNYNGLTDTRNCLQSLSKIKKNSFTEQLFVIDYSSNSLEADILRKEFPKTTVIRKERNLGFAGGNNIGVKKALDWGADYVLLLNNDTVVSDDFLSNLYAYLKKHPKVGCVSPKIYFARGYEFHKKRYKQTELGKVIWYAGGIIDWSNMYASHRGVDEVDRGQFDTVVDTDFISGCCVLVRRKLFKDLGLLNEKLFLYWEDNDFSIRAKHAGWKLRYVPNAYIWHKNAGSSGVGSEVQDYFMQRNRLWFGFTYAPLRTKLALVKQSLLQLGRSSNWSRKGIVDFYLRRMGRGSWDK
ncbi:MAG: glycosyltransferase family 2 protein [Patescibacteria group bacterium]